uniref:Uncharacterized protein n=2 Tax=Avena sativa TaxID=4498 RepID=A0ACD5W8A6_AVESA
MATAWKVAAATAVVGWFISPVIAFLLSKILNSLGFDAKKKLEELEFHIMPELQKTLSEVDQARMMQRGVKIHVATLDKMAAKLRRAREEAEEIADDHEEIELYRNTCWQRLCGAMKACTGIVWSGSARLLQWTQRISCLQRLYGVVKACIVGGGGAVAGCLGVARNVRSRLARLLPQWAPNWFKEPVHQVNTTAAASDNHVGVTIDSGVSQEEAISEATTPNPVSCSSLDGFKTFCSIVLHWVLDTYKKACVHRDLFHKGAGITSNQEDATALDFLLTAISRRNLKKRIEKVESTISEVKKSSILGEVSKTPPEDVANKDRSKIRIPSSRQVFGREALRDSIMEKLRKIPQGTGKCYSAIGIYGVAGSGKTTFARYIRDFIEEESKKVKHFDTVMCIHVSETFSVTDIFHEMLKDITNDRHSNISDREELEEKLKESLSGKRFFLILDDLWVKTKYDQQLEELISPLKDGLNGSKILMTARTKVAAGGLWVDELMEMPDLNEEEYFKMFMHYALGHTKSVADEEFEQVGASIIDEEFKQVGAEIAKKLHGSPIAAVIVAGRLAANQDIRYWKNTAQLDMLNHTMDALWWSYQQLSPDIRRCFEYCNIFPRRFKMRKEDLVHLWIAQGFVKTRCATEEMEDVAEGYIQELVSCSFLQPEKKWNREFFRIHDLLHDLADMVTSTDCFIIENARSHRGESWKGDIPQDVRHLFIQNYDAELITEKTLGLRQLLTLFINFVGEDTTVEEKVIESICKRLPKLRVLAIAFSQVYNPIKKPNRFSFPESISQLKYLRYLGFRTDYSCHISLPNTLNKLQHIQVLDFGDGDLREFMVSALVNLRHISCWVGVKLAYLGRLRSLQTLSCYFEVSDEQGCELKQLRDLNKLRGKLYIAGLENVKSKGQALEANLAAKERLIELELWWVFFDDATGCSAEVEAGVFEGLCPPAGLEKLEINNFVGSRYPDWMVGQHGRGLKHLQVLHLSKCSQLVSASGLAEAFPHLRVLELVYCRWDTLPVNMKHLTSLKELFIYECKNIRSLPTLPRSLEKFTLNNCDVEFVKSCQAVGHPNWQKIEHIPNKRFFV